MTIEKQNTWGWLLAIELFLGGAGAGLFLISFIMDLTDQYASLARIGGVIGPVLVLIGTVFLTAELNTWFKFYRVFKKPSTSWIARGSWILLLFSFLGLLYSLPLLWMPQLKDATPLLFVGAFAAIFSILVMTYSGFIFSASKRVPFWRSINLPLVFLISSLYTAMAIMLIIGGLVENSVGGSFNQLIKIEASLILLQIIVFGLSLGYATYIGKTASQSVKLLLKQSLFIPLVVGAGLILPVTLLIYSNVNGDIILYHVLAGALLLLGGLFFRYYILKAGVRSPVILP